jgi:hypothetical protein
MTDIIFSLGWSIVGGVLASLIAIFLWERCRRPRLVVEIPERILGEEPAVQPLDQTSRAFYHLTVKNRGKSPAYSCRMMLRFFDSPSGKELFVVHGKWDRGPQPLIYTPVPIRVLPNGTVKTKIGETRQDFLIPFAEVIDVHPGMPESFCVLVKYEGEQECYAFGAWSYIKGDGLKVDEKLGMGEYILQVELMYSGKRSKREKFVLRNYPLGMCSVELARAGVGS